MGANKPLYIIISTDRNGNTNRVVKSLTDHSLFETTSALEAIGRYTELKNSVGPLYKITTLEAYTDCWDYKEVAELPDLFLSLSSS